MPDVQWDFKIAIDGQELPEEEKRLISRVEFEESLESGHASTLAFTIKYPDHVEISPTDFRVESEIIFEIGRGGYFISMFAGVIVDMRLSLPSGSVSKIEFECHDLSYRLKRAGGPEIVVTGNNWEDVITKIVGGHGLRLQVPHNSSGNLLSTALSDDQSVVYGGVKTREEAYKSKHGTFTVSREEPGDTPWQAIRHIADKVGYRIFVRKDIVFVVPQDFAFPEQGDDLTLVYSPRAEDLTNTATIPIVELNLNSDLEGNISSIKTISFTPTEAVRSSRQGENWDGSIKVSKDTRMIMLDPVSIRTKQLYRRYELQQTYGAVSRASAGVKLAIWTENMFKATGHGIASAATATRDFVQGLFNKLVSGDPLGISTFQARLQKNLLAAHRDFLEPVPLSVEEPEVVISSQNLTTQQQADLAAEAHRQRVYDNLTRGNGRVGGDPRIRAGHKHLFLINSLGEMGRDYSGTYQITNARHTISDSDGYITEFEVSRRYARTPQAKGEVRR